MADPKVLWIAVQQKHGTELARLKAIAALVGVELPELETNRNFPALMYILQTSQTRLDHRIQCLDLIELKLLTLARNKKAKNNDE